jgi:speckle-type POZ protein
MPHDPDTTDLIHQSAPMAFSEAITNWGLPDFEKRTVIESSPYMHDDRLVIMCEVTVFKEPLVEEIALDSGLLVPPSDLSNHLGKLLESEEEADVTFKVKKEVFSAHRIVLAMRSPVFKAELYGPMWDMRTKNITVKDMQPDVFEALLHYIYIDSLPSMDDLDHDSQKNWLSI